MFYKKYILSNSAYIYVVCYMRTYVIVRNIIFQELMYSNPSRYAFLFQSYVQLTMLQLHTCKIPSPYKIMERSVYSAMCFVEHLKRRNVLHNTEVTVLEEWYDWCLRSANIETDLIGMYSFMYLKRIGK